MAPVAIGQRLVACMLNISEARSRDVVEKVARAAVFDGRGGQREGTTVLNIFNDHDYNRSVITITASIDRIREAVLSACEQACQLIDMRNHVGAHPCMGAVDLVPMYPLGEDVGLEDCGKEARALAAALTERIPGTSAFHFGFADLPQNRGLAQRRKEMGWFLKDPKMEAIKPDVGEKLDRRYGLTGVGASPYVMNCNVTIDTQDLGTGRRVAQALRESSPGGLPGVQVLALPHEGAMEIACNVESVLGAPPEEDWPTFSIRGQPYCHAPAVLISTRVAQLAEEHGVGTKGTALVGFTPQECRGLAEWALAQGIAEFWREQHKVRM
ncbi:formiminotransferase N-terminal subdomain-containing protein [Megalops cyprinoides]|uniref:formiminotransferase N-terminal subdomain-containing protein n=1 Tax=Megalops cyprinoides TaxID=118141 RepID=UPI0018650AEA|nr:formiminotransferase N-terminal subdomain-containing protein [Megalops cyprinoides]XP_036397048.1 formiminotransferase N-terminal subdomain-containing protein [Megalops cyprinoides]XP_036397049.1 formiminotransferase N-terminal subdomain-containing protein [Megalops cyprinoides]